MYFCVNESLNHSLSDHRPMLRNVQCSGNVFHLNRNCVFPQPKAKDGFKAEVLSPIRTEFVFRTYVCKVIVTVDVYRRMSVEIGKMSDYCICTLLLHK